MGRESDRENRSCAPVQLTENRFVSTLITTFLRLFMGFVVIIPRYPSIHAGWWGI